MTSTCLVVGAGDGLGAAISRRFAREGLHVAATRRRGDMAALVASVEACGGAITALHSDARDEHAVRALFDQVEAIGPVDVVVFNVGGNVRFPLLETTARVYRKVWEMCAFAGFLVGREAAGRMLPRGHGSILFTGATASLRGASGFSAFAGGKHALRALAQSMSREFAPQGLHVAHVVMDGAIDNANTRALFPETFENRPDDGIANPDHLAELYWQLHVQPRSAWTFEADARPWSERW